ncbi:MAG: hypothetical protein RQ952_01885 [Thermoproteota archaeon]|jgi:ABC-type transporter Mla subunit MlaD|nr:hypothetical protein [Thermoproteota archaeon]
MDNYRLLAKLAKNRASTMNETYLILKQSLKALKNLNYRRKNNKLFKLALLMFALPEPVITDILGIIFLGMSYRKKIRIDEFILKEMMKIKYDLENNFLF